MLLSLRVNGYNLALLKAGGLRELRTLRRQAGAQNVGTSKNEFDGATVYTHSRQHIRVLVNNRKGGNHLVVVLLREEDLGADGVERELVDASGGKAEVRDGSTGQ